MSPDEFRALREALKMTQAQLAERLGLSRMQINRYEAGSSPIKPVHEYALRWIAKDA